MKLLSCLNNTSYRPNKVLCVSKLSSLEFIKSRYPNLNEDRSNIVKNEMSREKCRKSSYRPWIADCMRTEAGVGSEETWHQFPYHEKVEQ